MSYTHAADYWLAYANAYLRDIRNNKFGLYGKDMEYCQFWFMRSIIPSLFDPSLDNHGYPLLPGDFHSQNIMVIDVDTPNPRISGVIDWEFSSAVFVTDFVFYPLFIQNHPYWDADNPLRERNIKDQATFDSLIAEAEHKRTSSEGPPLSKLFLNSRPTYLFCQLMKDPYTREAFYPLLFAYVYGDDEKFEGMYYNAVMDKGILQKETARLKMEREACLEARKVLGEDVIGYDLDDAGFAEIIGAHLDKFNGEESPVQDWLEYYRASKRDVEFLV